VWWLFRRLWDTLARSVWGGVALSASWCYPEMPRDQVWCCFEFHIGCPQDVKQFLAGTGRVRWCWGKVLAWQGLSLIAGSLYVSWSFSEELAVFHNRPQEDLVCLSVADQRVWTLRLVEWKDSRFLCWTGRSLAIPVDWCSIEGALGRIPNVRLFVTPLRLAAKRRGRG
jgi:hypothetical protein